MSLPDIGGVARTINSPLFPGSLADFYARRGEFRYSPGQGSHYLEDEKDPRRAGAIVIDPDHINKLVRYYGSSVEAIRALLIHEMGHFMYRFQDRATQPGTAQEVDASVSWCLKREAQASMFAYRVVKELKARGSSGVVVSPNGAGDLFSALAEAERAGRNRLELAYSAYASNPQYALYCRSKFIKAAPSQKMPQVRITGKRPAG
jgi:hypothetical protein